MRLLALTAVPALLLAGCLAAPEPQPLDAGAPAPPGQGVAPGEPHVLEWSGRVLAGPVNGLSHFRPAEDALWPAQQVGFLLDLPEAPQAMEVGLAWQGGGQWFIMLHSHKAEGTNVYVEHVTEMSAEQPQCLRVPAEDLVPGHWQVMVHTDDQPVAADFTLTVRTWGAEGSVVPDDRHGHWPQDGAFEVDEHPILPCEAAPEGHEHA